jgi:hypothetical protein
MSGQWPPEWEDSDTGLPDEWTVEDAGLDPEASEVTLFLASMPSPVLPASFEARISAAIAAEATARANGTAPASTAPASTASAGTAPASTASAGTASAGTASAGTASADTASAHSASAGLAAAGTESVDAGTAAAETDDAKTTDRSSPLEFSPAAAESGSVTAARNRRRRTSAASRRPARRSGPTGARPGGRRRRFRLPSPAVTSSLLVVLFIVGFAVVLTQFSGGPSSSTSYAGPDAGGTSAEGAPSAASAHSSVAGPSRDEPEPAYQTQFGQNAKFVVIESGVQYQGSALASEVRQQLSALNLSAATPTESTVPTGASAPASSMPSASAASPPTRAPSAKLEGCVSHLTRGATPSLVDQASYDGIPAYIIAVPNRVWVVRLGCTAADPQQITSMSLTGLFRESQRPRIG